MKRRTYILGLGAATGGLASAIGTGAFDAARLDDRGVSVSVVNDDQGLIGLVPNDDIAGVMVDDSTGQLVIALDDPGINTSSAYQFGAFTKDLSDETLRGRVGDRFSPVTYEDDTGFHPENNFNSAFMLMNQTSETKEVDMELIVDDLGDDEPGFFLEVHDEDGGIGNLMYPHPIKINDIELGSGEAIGVSFAIDASESAVGDGVSGQLSVSARSVDSE